ncbi:hypothetical protein [Thermosipho atlanticus]|uniref:hypothetical protein n=1 Tax=Thermosipho atlanticus TaxID=238991 RepID=UPI000933AF0F|nr:hypothetical protein [Thermosipho atlanticus]
MNSTEGQITTDLLNGITILTDSVLLNELIEENYTLGEILNKKYLRPILSFPIDDFSYLGCTGLLIRGGIEFGKVKFVH